MPEFLKLGGRYVAVAHIVSVRLPDTQYMNAAVWMVGTAEPLHVSVPNEIEMLKQVVAHA